VVAECEWQRETLARLHLHRAGLPTFWVHYATVIAAHPRNGRKAIPTVRGYYPPWLFVAVVNPADDVSRIRDTRYVSGVLWSEADRHYLPEWWLTWIVSGKERIDRETGEVVKPPVCIDPVSGLFEAPYSANSLGRGKYAPGTQVRCRGAWEAFVSTVINDTGKSIDVEHGQLFGKTVKMRYLPEQVERA